MAAREESLFYRLSWSCFTENSSYTNSTLHCFGKKKNCFKAGMTSSTAEKWGRRCYKNFLWELLVSSYFSQLTHIQRFELGIGPRQGLKSDHRSRSTLRLQIKSMRWPKIIPKEDNLNRSKKGKTITQKN